MNSLTKVDLHYVVSRLPRDIRKLLTDHPELVVAGGFIRATIAGEEVSDIDIVGSNAEQLKQLALELAVERKGRKHETKNAITVLSLSRIPVQFITRWTFSSPEDVIESFDFTICQAAVFCKDKKWQSVVSPGFYPDLAARRLTYTAPTRSEGAGGSLLRVRKFLAKGYNIQAPSLARVVARVVAGVRDTIDLRNEEDSWPIITGLLREVDPLLVIDGLDLLDEHQVLQNARESEGEEQK